jgi:hypothetical protein
MQINLVKKRKLIKILRCLKESVDVFYFADSFGNMNENNTRIVSRIIKNHWNKEFGIHAHDNSGFALANTIEALNNGAKFLDCTMLGMGRGAGNVATETLITELNARGIKKYLAQPIYSLATGFFQKYKKRYNWGSSIYYHLAAIKNIHPSYIQELLFDNRYNHDDIGWNYRFTNMQEALGLSQLDRITSIIKKKIKIGKSYYSYLKNNKKIYIQKPIYNNIKNVYWVVGILIKNKKISANIIRSKLIKIYMP